MKKSKIILLTGGARSGKSSFALELAKKTGKKAAFIATCEPKDAEMKRRVRLHRISRPKNYQVIEEYRDLCSGLNKVKSGTDVVVIDCITLYVSNLMMKNKNGNEILKDIGGFISAAKGKDFSVIIVTNEVGSSIVPSNKLSRDFRDIAGKANCYIASKSDEAYVMISGIPLKLK